MKIAKFKVKENADAFLVYLTAFWLFPFFSPMGYWHTVLIYNLVLGIGSSVFFIFWAVVDIYERRKGGFIKKRLEERENKDSCA